MFGTAACTERLGNRPSNRTNHRARPRGVARLLQSGRHGNTRTPYPSSNLGDQAANMADDAREFASNAANSVSESAAAAGRKVSEFGKAASNKFSAATDYFRE